MQNREEERDRPRAHEHSASACHRRRDLVLPLCEGGDAVRLRCVSAALIAVGGVLQVVGYAITALELRQTRRRLRADLVPFPGYQAVDFSQTTDSASVRRPTLDERLTTVEREVGAVAHRLQTSEDEAVTRRLRDEAASALASRLARFPRPRADAVGERRAVRNRRGCQRPGRTRIAVTLGGVLSGQVDAATKTRRRCIAQRGRGHDGRVVHLGGRAVERAAVSATAKRGKAVPI